MRKTAERQLGHITLDQLRGCGLSPKQLHGRRRRGELVPVLPGVLRLAGAPDSFASRMRAVALWLNDKEYFSGPTAAYIFGLDGIDMPRRISVARYNGGEAPEWVKVTRLNPDDVPPKRSVNGHRVCSVERALAECCGALPARKVGRAIDDALRRRLTTLDRLLDFAKTWRAGRRGARVFRSLLRGRDARDERVRTRFETEMLQILRRISDHQFVPNFEVVVRGNRYFLDFYLPDAKLGIECHSFRWHMGLHNEDARRDRRIASLGIEILYFSWDDVMHHADQVEREIREAMARRLTTLP